MRRLFERGAAVVGIAAMLSACSMFTPPESRLMFGMLPTNELGYEVTEQGDR